MNLADGVIDVRDALGEFTEFKFSTAKIIADLNESAKRLCSAAQNLSGFYNITIPYLTAYSCYSQEVNVPASLDQIEAVGYYSGQLFQLKSINAADLVQLGGYSAGIPLYFYTRTDTKINVPQVLGGDVISIPIPGITDPVTVVGLYPAPNQAGSVHIWASKFHKRMTNPLDVCEFPEEFKDAWTSFAISKAKRKESAYDEANFFMQLHEDGKEKMKQYYVTSKMVTNPPSYGADERMFMKGSSAIIFLDQTPGLQNP